MQTAPSSQSTAKCSTAPSTFKPRVRRLSEGRYLVESQSKPGTGHPVTADYCNCPSFQYRGRCRHVELVRAIDPRMQAWYGQAATPAPLAPQAVPMSAGPPSGITRPVRGSDEAATLGGLAAADLHLARLYRALADTHEQDDSYAALLRQVDQAERVVAAGNYSAMRQGA